MDLTEAQNQKTRNPSITPEAVSVLVVTICKFGFW